MRVLKTRWFSRFARKESLSDHNLAEAVREIEKGLHDGDLGGNLIKKRMARAGKGKRSGYRTIIIYHQGKRAVFVHGFAKSARTTLSPVEVREYQKLAQIYMRLTEAHITKAVRARELQEVAYDDEAIPE